MVQPTHGTATGTLTNNTSTTLHAAAKIVAKNKSTFRENQNQNKN
jgi:hypothetical protein